jgi:hypothetical protein
LEEKMKQILGSLVLVLAVTGVGLAQSSFYFPQVADGTQSGGITWVTGIAITNSGNPGAPVASGTITFFQGDGSVLNIGFNDETGKPVSTGNTIIFNNIAPGQSHFYTSTAAGALTTGYAKVTSSSPLTGTAVFSEKQGGATIAQAAVFSAVPLSKQATFVVEDDFSDTAVALVNPQPALANVTFVLYDTNGNTIDTVNNFLLPTQNHVAEFVSQLFPSVKQKLPFHGTMQVISATALTMTSLLFTAGSQFYTFPTITFASLLGDPLNSLERMFGTLRAEFSALI